MSTAELEKRLTALEREVAELRAIMIIPPTSPNHWIEKIAGKYSSPEDRAAFDEAMRLGREWRESQRPKPRHRKAAKR
jgi:hypothetical protein